MAFPPRQDYLTLKEQRDAAAKEDSARLRAEAEAKSREEREAEDRKMAGIRARALGTQSFITGQMTVGHVGEVFA